MRNAIILAAGKSNRFAPFTYERPKGLFCVRGEILIERQIRQLHEAGIDEIVIVVGYMKEKFFYLEKKYGVKLIVNNKFGQYGNIYSLYVAKEYLNNTFICCADHYFINNPFKKENKDNKSYRSCVYIEGKFREFAVTASDASVITSVAVGGADSLAMVGPAYINDGFSKIFVEKMKSEINDFGVSSLFWEEFFSKHISELTLYSDICSSEDIQEFDSIDDLRSFDSEFLLNVDSKIIDNISKTLRCNPNDICEISVINAGLTNVSFAFKCGENKYVYRHPGGTAGKLIDRNTELFAQKMAMETGIDRSFLDMSLQGWKISYFVKEAQNCEFDGDNNSCCMSVDDQLRMAMEQLRILHRVPIDEMAIEKFKMDNKLSADFSIKEFDNIDEGLRLINIASATKGDLKTEFATEIEKAKKLYSYIEKDAKRMGIRKVLCHNDVYAPNYLIDDENVIYLIDWEYAGVNYDANDIACILCRYDLTEEQVDRYLRAYVGRELSFDEHRYYIAFIAICAFYWFAWGLYKGSVGDDDGFFFLPAYRNFIKYIDKALESYKILEVR